MKHLALLLVSFLSASCASTPVEVSYQGYAGNHDYSVSYGTVAGIRATVSQK
jgi:hypothetical protein